MKPPRRNIKKFENYEEALEYQREQDVEEYYEEEEEEEDFDAKYDEYQDDMLRQEHGW